MNPVAVVMVAASSWGSAVAVGIWLVVLAAALVLPRRVLSGLATAGVLAWCLFWCAEPDVYLPFDCTTYWYDPACWWRFFE